MAYTAADDRYDSMTYRRTGRSGLDLPAISLGLWHNFGDDVPFERQRAILRRAFDLGVTHFDLANNYGPPYGSAETNFGRHLADDFAPYRDELVISSKAGWDMWPGPTARAAARGSTCWPASTSRWAGWVWTTSTSSTRTGPTRRRRSRRRWARCTPPSRAGKALYVGISSYSPEDTARAAEILADLGTPLLIHQPSYSMLNRWIETEGLLDTLEEVGAGCIAFSPLAQGMLTDKYLNGIPEGSRASQDKSLSTDLLSEESLAHIRALNDIAQQRGQSLAQMALAWALRDRRVTTVLIGASSVGQLEQNVGALENLTFGDDELAAIDEHAVDTGIDLWAQAREGAL